MQHQAGHSFVSSTNIFEKQIIWSQNKAHLKWTRGFDSDLIGIETSLGFEKSTKLEKKPKTKDLRDLMELSEIKPN